MNLKQRAQLAALKIKLKLRPEAVVDNPYHRGESRNQPCPCASGKKAKHCHGNHAKIRADLLVLMKQVEERQALALEEAREKAREQSCTPSAN